MSASVLLFDWEEGPGQDFKLQFDALPARWIWSRASSQSEKARQPSPRMTNRKSSTLVSVKRNLDRFPEDFMFQLTTTEWTALRSQFVISNDGVVAVVAHLTPSLQRFVMQTLTTLLKGTSTNG